MSGSVCLVMPQVNGPMRLLMLQVRGCVWTRRMCIGGASAPYATPVVYEGERTADAIVEYIEKHAPVPEGYDAPSTPPYLDE